MTTEVHASATRLVVEAAQEPLADPRIRKLVARYAELAGASLTEISPNLLRLNLPPGERAFFRRRDQVLLALSLEALEGHPEAEMAVIGSAFVEQLLEAIRARGTRLTLGIVAPAFSADPSTITLDVPVANGTSGPPAVKLARHPAGRLLARVLLRAGAVVEEHLVESDWLDFTTGASLPADLAECCAALERERATAVPSSAVPEAALSAARPVQELVRLAIADLQRKLGGHVSRLTAESESALAAELRRLDGYYGALLDDDVTAAERRTIEAERTRRVEEERARHHVRAVVHPLQMVEAELVVQRAEWSLTTPTGHTGRFPAHRALSGAGAWITSCPTCATTPTALVICREDHVGCERCTLTCSTCGNEFCRSHGLERCHVDGAPACDEHARNCQSCRRDHCSAHEGTCADGEHHACTACLAPCAVCGRPVCAAHAFVTTASAPLGSRRLCAQCTVFCEGGRSEPVGRDEVVRCASCDRYVCTAHQATCVVDQKVHCSTHLRRTDRSRRLVCESHRASCSYEREAILASDEVSACVQCGTPSCDQHGAPCVDDGRWHCRTHLHDLRDRPGAFACEAHRTVCHVDGVAFSLVGTSECPVCERKVCAAHAVECSNCGRSVCVNDWHRGARKCATCDQLRSWSDPSDGVLAAVLEAYDGEPPGMKEWRVARDATHILAEVSHGWTRRTVMAVRHGDNRAQHVMTHSALGSNRRR